MSISKWEYFPILIAYAVIVENGVKLRLNIVDTPGYGDQINNENWYVVSRSCLFPVPYAPLPF